MLNKNYKIIRCRFLYTNLNLLFKNIKLPAFSQAAVKEMRAKKLYGM